MSIYKDKVKIKVNGKDKIISDNTTVEKFLEELNIKPQGIAVELNLEIVPKSRYVETILKDGDKVEIVQMVGGG
ncbi:MAG: sulfur carrier protein ThiS [Deltaproteobacteria bacterium]|nr:sulfur carrier protein ThiS [Deltaproteobacteria bacterium]